VEVIGYAKKNKIPGALISIDMAKAFDTVSHEFLNDCYTFFDFVTIFQNMLRTVGKDRTACILMDNGSLSENFNLNSGRPQGEVLSPVQYNIGEQILLFKVELDPGIKSLFNNIWGPNTAFPITCNNVLENKAFRLESEGETNKAEGFADDANILTRADQESISNAELLIERFSEISGLKCNFSKSSVMYIGTKTTGIVTKFPEVHSYTLLGIEIDSEASLLVKNFSKAKKNIQHIINFWARFDLSLPGRIAIAKTFLLSQLNYFGSIFMPPDPDLTFFQAQIDNFCLKNLKFTMEKLNTTLEEGGLGLINLKDSLISQQSLWFKKSALSSRDNWRWQLWNLGSGNCLTVPALCPLRHPILSGLVSSFRTFLSKFNLSENNIEKSFILNNPVICVQNGFSSATDQWFWTCCGSANIYKIPFLKVGEFFDDGKIKTLTSLNETFAINLPVAIYLRLVGILAHLKRNRGTPLKS
jgi:hypothetical protein